MEIARFILTLFSFSFIGSCVAQTETKSLSEFIQANVENTHKKEKLPGVFVGILNNGQRSYFNAGFANIENQTPFDSSNVFEIGSITKTFTAYVLMAVLLENKIAETDFIVKYLPDSVQKNKNLNSISFLSLMNHTSGLPRLPDNMKLTNKMPYDDYTAENLFACLKSVEPKPDGKSNYSNLGAGLAGVLAERISGKTYDQLISQYFFSSYKTGDKKNISQGYFSETEKIDFWKMDVLAPCGSLKYSADQMLNYLQSMCFPKTETAKKIVDKITTQTVSLNEQLAVGYGWHIINSKNQTQVYWHNGGTYGFSTFCAFSKDKSKAVIVVLNQFNKNGACDGLGVNIFKKLISEESQE